eukprot:528266_1
MESDSMSDSEESGPGSGESWSEESGSDESSSGSDESDSESDESDSDESDSDESDSDSGSDDHEEVTGANVVAMKHADIVSSSKFPEQPGIDASEESDRMTPLLHWAVRTGDNEEVVRVLSLESTKINVNQTDNYGETPLYVAVKNGNVKIVEILLGIPGMDVNRANDDLD